MREPWRPAAAADRDPAPPAASSRCAVPDGDAGAAHLPVERARRQELGQRELLEHSGEGAHRALGLDQLVEQRRRRHEPRQPEAGHEALGRGSRVHHLRRGERLHRADRPAVVAELAVVVVLEHDRAAGPRAEAIAARRRDGTSATPSGNWCAGREQDGRLVAELVTTATRSSTPIALTARPPPRQIAATAHTSTGTLRADRRTAAAAPRRSLRTRRSPTAAPTRGGPRQVSAAARAARAARAGRRSRATRRPHGERPARRGATRPAGTRRDRGRGSRSNRAAEIVRSRAGSSAAASDRSATHVPDPWRATSQPSATSCAYASATVLRAMPRSTASARTREAADGARRRRGTASRSSCSRRVRRRVASRSSRSGP